MAIKKINDEPKLSAFPEEVDENGLKIYGETSYEDQIAALSHYLHTTDFEGTQIEVQERRNELMALIREFLEYKDRLDDFTDEEIAYAADNPLEFDMFREFFKVPFPDPQQPNFTFIDLFAGMGGFRLAMQAQGGKCVFSSEWNKYAQRTYLANFGEMPFGDITKEITKSCVRASRASHSLSQEFQKRRALAEKRASRIRRKELCSLMWPISSAPIALRHSFWKT